MLIVVGLIIHTAAHPASELVACDAGAAGASADSRPVCGQLSTSALRATADKAARARAGRSRNYQEQGTGGIRPVRPHAIRADTRPPRPDARHADLLQHGFELRQVAALPGRDHDRHGLLALLDGQVQLGGEPAARPSQSVITGLGEQATWWFLPQVALLAVPGRMLVSAADRGVDTQVPRDRTVRIGQGLKLGEYPVPGAVPLPPAEQVLDPTPRPVLVGHIPPRNPGTDPEPSSSSQGSASRGSPMAPARAKAEVAEGVSSPAPVARPPSFSRPPRTTRRPAVTAAARSNAASVSADERRRRRTALGSRSPRDRRGAKARGGGRGARASVRPSCGFARTCGGGGTDRVSRRCASAASG